MGKIKDLTGLKFGMLTVVSFAGVDKHYQAKWNCLCECGNKKVVSATNLRGKTKSCGCYRKSVIANDLVGKRFGRLVVIERRGSSNRGDSLWLCECDCGNQKVILNGALVSGATKSCGCYQKEMGTYRGKSRKTHGKTDTRIYNIWCGIKSRCSGNSDNRHNKDYYERGIFICDEWQNSFENFYDWAITHGYNDNLQIDRIDNDKGYSPNNCRWVNGAINSQNRRVKSDNKSGIRGVSPKKYKSGKTVWTVEISHNKQHHWIGTYNTLEDAKNSRIESELLYWGHSITQEKGGD